MPQSYYFLSCGAAQDLNFIYHVGPGCGKVACLTASVNNFQCVLLICLLLGAGVHYIIIVSGVNSFPSITLPPGY